MAFTKDAVQQKQKSRKAAHVIFTEDESLERAMESDTSSMCLPFVEGELPRGMDRWMAEYLKARPDPEKLQKQVSPSPLSPPKASSGYNCRVQRDSLVCTRSQVDAFMQAFDERTRSEKEAAQAGPVVDEDGFILVTRKKSKNRILKRAGEDNEAVDNKARKKKKKVCAGVAMRPGLAPPHLLLPWNISGASFLQIRRKATETTAAGAAAQEVRGGQEADRAHEGAEKVSPFRTIEFFIAATFNQMSAEFQS